MCRSDPWRDHKPNVSALEFLVVPQRFENLLSRKIWRQIRRQIEPPQKINNGVTLIRRQPRFFNRNGAGSDNSEACCFAVKKFLIIASALNAVTNSMSEIENRAFDGAITLIFRNDLRFY